MRFAASLFLVVAGLLVRNPPASQTVNMERPQEINAQHRLSPEEIRERLSASQVQNDAKELAELCAAVTSDMDDVKKGLLPKDSVDRLKRMEKLSKRMRDNLARVSPEH